MKNKYIDLIEQTFHFPQDGFKVQENNLLFNEIPLMDIIKEHGTPLKISYLPKIGSQIQKAKNWFTSAYKKADYKGSYTYCYCTKSSHFSFVMEEVLKNGCHLETSSAYDIEIIRALAKRGSLSKQHFVVCNGFKRPLYIQNIASLINEGFENVIPVLDNMNELHALDVELKEKAKLGLRIASEEDPSFSFYTSRLGINHEDITSFYEKNIHYNPKYELKMLHFFINTGISDSTYYWSELSKCLKVYIELKKVCPTLDSLNIGGGFPIKNSLGFEFDYEYLIDEIVLQIKNTCVDAGVDEPNIFTEFGTFTVGESGAILYNVLDEKNQNDREAWYMIDGSFITHMPDTWAINKRFILLAINNWDREYQSVNLGGLTCDSMDYYNEEAHVKRVFLPKLDEINEQYLGFFNTGAYQDSIGGIGGLQHCLVPTAKHVIIEKDEEGNFTSRVFRGEQQPDEMMKTLGYID